MRIVVKRIDVGSVVFVTHCQFVLSATVTSVVRQMYEDFLMSQTNSKNIFNKKNAPTLAGAVKYKLKVSIKQIELDLSRLQMRANLAVSFLLFSLMDYDNPAHIATVAQPIHRLFSPILRM